MNPEEVIQILNELRALPFFPNDEYAMAALARLVGEMCHNIEQVRWLVDRMTSGIYERWHGPQEMRACFCGRYRPKDGINAYSSVYPDGLPPDPTAPPRLEAGPPITRKLIGSGGAQRPEDSAPIRNLARPKDLNAVGRRKPQPEVPNPNFKPITQADVDRERERLRQQRAESELHSDRQKAAAGDRD